MVAGDTGKCPGEDPAPGGPSGVLHTWCNPSKAAGLADTLARDAHAESQELRGTESRLKLSLCALPADTLETRNQNPVFNSSPELMLGKD